MGGWNFGNSSYLWQESHLPTVIWWQRHLIYQVWNGNADFSSNIQTLKFIKDSMGQWFPYSKNMRKNSYDLTYLWSYGHISTNL